MVLCDQDTLFRIIARAAPMRDRMSCAGFQAQEGHDHVSCAKRLDRWVRAIAGDDREKWQAMLSVRGLDDDALLRAVSDVSVSDMDALPPWATTFLTLMDAIGRLTDERTVSKVGVSRQGAENVFAQVLEPFLEVGLSELEGIVDGSGLTATMEAKRNMVGILGARLCSVIIYVIDSDLQDKEAASAFLERIGVRPLSHLDASGPGWLDRYDRYPGLAYVMSVVYMHWRAYVAELAGRLVADLDVIERVLFRGKRVGALVDFGGDAGDLHDKGRAVAVLTFEGGHVVYKPKNLQISAAFMDLISFLNESGMDPSLSVRSIMTRDGYAWEEYIEHAPCQTEEEVRRFYHRFGMNLRLLQLLGARDFWLDNLISCGEYPVFIDLEMVVQMPIKAPEGLLPSAEAAFTRLQESAAPTGAIVERTPLGQGVRAEDLGALTPPRTLETPFRLTYSKPMRAVLAPVLGDHDRSRWTKIGYTPTLNGESCIAANFLDEVAAGFCRMHECLRANRDALLAADSPLQRMALLPVRHIHRDTWSCLEILNHSVRTACLVDGVQRDIFLEGLWQVVVEGDDIDVHRAAVVTSEIESFRQLDVPLFQAVPSQRDLFPSTGGVVQEYFDDAAMPRIWRRLKEIEKVNLDEELDLVRSDFSTGEHVAPGPPHATHACAGEVGLPHERLLDNAITIGDFILSVGIVGEADDMSWLGLTYQPFLDMQSVDVLRSDLLSGACGVAILFAELFHVTRELRFREAAMRALAATRRGMEGKHPLFKQLVHAERRNEPVFCGGYYGLGSQVYTLRRCAATLGEPALAEIAASCVQSMPLERICSKAPLDLISGTAGLLLSLLPARWDTAAFEARESASQLAAYITATIDSGQRRVQSPYPENAALLRGLIPEQDALDLCLARASADLHMPASGAARAEPFRLPAANSPSRARREEEAACLTARLAIAQYARRSGEALCPAIQAVLDAKPDELASLELLALLDLAITAGRPANEVFTAKARKLAAELDRRHALYGTWFPDSFAADRHNLSAITGVAAVGLQFLRLAAPMSIPSLRLLE